MTSAIVTFADANDLQCAQAALLRITDGTPFSPLGLWAVKHLPITLSIARHALDRQREEESIQGRRGSK